MLPNLPVKKENRLKDFFFFFLVQEHFIQNMQMDYWDTPAWKALPHTAI